MKKLMLMFILGLLPGALFAETVMLLTRMQPAESSKGANVERFVAVVDGVEDQFFNSGHIIFDAGLPSSDNNESDSVARTDIWAERTAKEGGAAFLLIVDLGFPDAEKSAPVPSSISYRFLDLKSGSLLAEGKLDTTVPEGDLKSKKPYELCFALGQKIARNAMKKWSLSSYGSS